MGYMRSLHLLFECSIPAVAIVICSLSIYRGLGLPISLFVVQIYILSYYTPSVILSFSDNVALDQGLQEEAIILH